MIPELITLVLSYWHVILLFSLITWLVRNKFNNGLNKYPGPLAAGFTNWWRFVDVYNRKPERTHIELHRKYGDIVRLGPNVLSFANPEAIKTIYGLNKGFTKSEFYPIQQATSKGIRLQSLFSTTDEVYHAKYRRCVNNAFSMSNMVTYEPLVDSTIALFIQRTKELFIEQGQRCNLSEWVQFFAFDVIGELTWSKRLGYIENNKDVGGVVTFVGDFMSYSAVVGQMPFLDLVWKKNPLRLKCEALGLMKKVFPVTKFALDRAAERQDDEKSTTKVDLLSKFKQAQEKHEFMTDNQVLASCTSMIFAGSETTAISLSSIFYFIAKHPRVYEKLMAELDEHTASGKIADRPNREVSWTEAQQLRYLEAVVQESFRMHPAPGLLLERYTPPQGVKICGEYIPGGVIVGCNPWVVHRRQEIFGEDVETFRPERWIEASPEQLKSMTGAMLQFGAGARTCIGKNISLLEIYKLVPTFLRNFKLKMDCDDWKTHNGWFVTQKEFYMQLEAREGQSTI